jgi:hypothetical protein
MKLWDWLRRVNARLDIHIYVLLDPSIPSGMWECRIYGLPNPTEKRPATFIVSRLGGIPVAQDGCIWATSKTADDAYARAVKRLRLLKLSVIGQGREDEYTFPHDLTA